MSRRMPSACEELARIQAGVISRRQALEKGMSGDAISWRLRSGRWQVLQHGVYSIFTGPLAREATLWAAVLRAGPGAALSHQTAAELFKLSDQPSALVHVTIPGPRQITRPAGVVVHRSVRLDQAVHPGLQPPRTSLEETVLDLADLAATFDEAFGLVSAACQRGLTTPPLLLGATSRRARLRWRSVLVPALTEISSGVHSALEYRYVHRVERPHGLPTAVRQVRVDADGQNRYLDNLYEDYRLCVELDGRLAHPESQRWLDQRRANAIAAKGMMMLRYGWFDVDRRSCQTAVQVAATLTGQGWAGPARPCQPGCPVGRPPAERR